MQRACWERGAASGGGTVWRHGCRHRASRDGFTACPDIGCGAAPPTDSAYRSILCTTSGVPRECFGLLRALARVPVWDTPQVRPCRLWRGIHAAQGPTPAHAQAPPIAIGYGKKCRGHAGLQVLRSVHPGAVRADRWLTDYVGHEIGRQPHVLESIACRSAATMLGTWCRVRGRDRVAAWMPPPSLQGRIDGASRHRMRRRATDRPCMPTSPAHAIRRFMQMLRLNDVVTDEAAAKRKWLSSEER
ncbi:hypothetical protein GGR72_002538 [Xanthomonas arboricola]|nr:hypothetical protein [Xanthomonas arboricola]